MKKKLHLSSFTRLLLLMTILLIQYQATAQLPAFPGAEGFGKYAIGGRNGSVYRVTNLNNAGAGSLRDAVSQPNRIVVFDVAGVIRITSRIVVSPNIYIAGQTAPGEGITVYGNGWSFSNAHNTICRYIRIRMGATGDSGKDAVGIADGRNMIFDHCSISWGRDETFSINSSTSENITIQNTIMSQGLMTHSAGGLMQAPGGITLYRNLYVDNQTRNNKIKGINQYVNNLVYNWTSGAYIMGGDSQGESFANAIGNVFIQGPGNGTRPFSVGNSLYHIYEHDNLHDNNRNGSFDPYVIPQNEFGGGPDFQATPYNYPALPTVAAHTLLTNLLPTVGASLPYRDLADYYVINEVKSLGLRGEFIAKEDALPFGAPSSWSLWGGNARVDSDGDGIPDAWETANGLNPASAADAMQIASNGYANIENYINSITAEDTQDFLRAPLALQRDSATQTSIYLSWLDYTEKEAGYIIERKENGVFVEIARTAANVNTYEVTGLEPEESGVYRVRAFNASTESGNSNELTAKTKPVEVPVIDPDTFVPDLTWTGAASQQWDLTSQNWINAANETAVFTNDSKLLFGEAGSGEQSIIINETLTPGDVLFKSAGNYNITGTGVIEGIASVNKTGPGSLTLQAGNTYSGATVLHNGVINFSQLVNSGQPSSIGSSPYYGFNWVWKGGTWNYTGGTTTTDRQAIIDRSTTFAVSDPAATVTFTGQLSGVGGLIKEGPGKLSLRSANMYEGETVIKNGILEVRPLSVNTEAENLIHNGVALGTSNIVRFEGGTLTSLGGSDAFYETYPMDFHIAAGTVNTFAPQRTANLKMNVYGSGTLNYDIVYSRELIQGDWSGFTGKLNANGIGTLTNGERPMLMIDNGVGLPNTLVSATGNTKITSYSNNRTLYFGGLSGTSGTTLASGDKNAGGTATWVVGGANTNETFAGVINNEAYGSSSAQGTTHIVKEGEGVWRLTNTNPYNGTTTIENGVLVVNGNKSGSGIITVNEGALAGTGSLSGNVTVVAGAIEPGDSSIGTITLRNNVTLETGAKVNIDINKTNGTWDKVNVTNALNYNGILSLQVTGTLASGDAFKIFTSGSYAGNFTAIQPAEPGTGLQWRFTPETGLLEVVEPGFVKAPSNLTAETGLYTSPTAAYVTLSWQDNSENELHFVIERSSDGETFTVMGQAAADATSYTDNDVNDNTKYYYRIKAVGDVKESIYTTIVEITTPSLTATPDQAVTPAPAHLAEHVMLNNGKTNLAWSGSTNTTTYSVYFGTVSGSLTKLDDVDYTTNATLETAVLQPGTIYYWRVDATNPNGTTTGTEWQFKTSPVPFAQAGDYRSRQSGGWADASSWETYDGENWAAATGVPGGSSNATIRGGHTVTIAVTTTVKNLVIENNGTFKSSGSQRNIRVTGSVLNYGTFGSSSSSSERVNLNPYLANGEVYIGGTNVLYVNEFRVHSIAQTTHVLIDVDISTASYFRAIFEPNTNGVDQDDDDISVTINPGKSVNMINGSNSYFHQVSSGSTNTNNTLGSFGKYTYNILGTLNMGAVTSATSCIIAHTSKASSKVTVNVEGTWITPAAMRIVSAATTVPSGGIEYNISGNGLVNAVTRSTNLVQQNATSGVIVPWNITDNGALRISIAANATATYHTAAGGLYSPVRIKSNDAANAVNVGVVSQITPPLVNGEAVVKNQYNITPVNTGANLEISLGWLTGSQGSLFNPAGNVLIGHHDGSAWDYTPATVSGAGTAASPYYATANGFTAFSPFIVTNQQVALPARLVSFTGNKTGDKVQLQWHTASEVNVKDFTVERSSNGMDYSAIGTVKAANNSATVNDYTFTDAAPGSGIAYYRLKINDYDGTARTSNVITIKLDPAVQLFTVYPNPVQQQLTVKHIAANDKATISLFNLSGKLVFTKKIASGNIQTNLTVNQLPAGMYTLVWYDGSVQQTIKFMKN